MSKLLERLGTWRRFGLNGPIYEILDSAEEIDDADQLVRVRVVESGEEFGYPLAKLLADPRED